jgi:hypothetical protein
MTETRFVWWCGAIGEARSGSGPECGTQDEPEIVEDDMGVFVVENAIIWCSVCGRLAPHDDGCRWVESKSLPFMRQEMNDG